MDGVARLKGDMCKGDDYRQGKESDSYSVRRRKGRGVHENGERLEQQKGILKTKTKRCSRTVLHCF